MHVAKLVTTSVTGIALAFSMLASTIPANAATGWHGAYFSESDFVARSSGQTAQFAVGYTNTGDQAWVKGAANQQANLGTAAPLDNTADFTAGWASSWLSANRYTAQNAALVAPGQIGFFIYNITVPANAVAGEHRFYGRPVIDGVTYLEDYGYYQSVVVTAGSVLISNTAPATPSTVNQPVVNGTGATAASTVTVLDGSTSVGTVTADSAGAFSLTTSVLADGCHTLTASSAGPVTGTTASSGNSVSYCVDRTAPTVSSVTAPNGRTIVVTYNEAVNSSSTSATGAANPANYGLDTAACGLATLPGGSTIAASTDKMTYTITLGGAGLLSPSGHTLNVGVVTDLAGNAMTCSSTAFTVNDSTGPAITTAAANATIGGTTTAVVVTWNEPAQCVGAYNVDGIIAAAVGAGSTASKCAITSAQTLAQGTTHTLTSTNEKDAVGNTQSPNPASASFTVGTSSATITANSATATELQAQVVFSTVANPAPTGTYTVQTANGTIVPHVAVARDATTTTVDIPMTSPFTVVGGGCTGTATTCALTITVTGETGASAETQNPPSQVLSATATKDTTGPTLSGVTQSGTTQTLFDVVWSEAVGVPQGCVTTPTCPIRIKSGSTIIASTILAETATSINLTAIDNVAADTKTRLTAASAIPGGAYTFTAGAGAVLDLSPATNPSTAGSIPMSVSDTSRPTMVFALIDPCTAGNPCKQFLFAYNEKMATSGAGSVIDLTHYTLNGAPVVGTASVDTTGQLVVLTLTANAPAGADQFAVTGVTDTSGNLINPNPTNANFTRVP